MNVSIGNGACTHALLLHIECHALRPEVNAIVRQMIAACDRVHGLLEIVSRFLRGHKKNQAITDKVLLFPHNKWSFVLEY